MPSKAPARCSKRAGGRIDHESGDIPFDAVDYYVAEMGTPLSRRLAFFEKLQPADCLVMAKTATARMEDELRDPQGKRRVNLDVGYIDHHKVVLASLKEAGQKIYLGDGVYGDWVLRFHQGRFVSFPWTFPDFSDGRYNDELGAVRRSYLRQRQEAQRSDKSLN